MIILKINLKINKKYFNIYIYFFKNKDRNNYNTKQYLDTKESKTPQTLKPFLSGPLLYLEPPLSSVPLSFSLLGKIMDKNLLANRVAAASDKVTSVPVPVPVPVLINILILILLHLRLAICRY
jgi:hypothetical protein